MSLRELTDALRFSYAFPRDFRTPKYKTMTDRPRVEHI